MKNDIILTLTKNGLVIKDVTVIGMQNENNVSNIIYNFVDTFINGTGYLEVNFGYIHHYNYVCTGNESGPYQIKGFNISFTMPNIVANDELIYYPINNQLILVHNSTTTQITTTETTSTNKLTFNSSQKGYYQMAKNEADENYNLPILNTLLLQKSKIYLQLTIYENNNLVYKSNQTYLEVKESINATDSIIQEYPSIMSILANKVDKIEGKQLSTNDFTNADKTKLDGIEDGATKVTKTSDITNDSGFIDKNVNDLTNYTKTSDLGSLSFKNKVNYNTDIDNLPDLNAKQDKLISGQNIKTINNQSILGSGNIVIQSGGDVDYFEVVNGQLNVKYEVSEEGGDI